MIWEGKLDPRLLEKYHLNHDRGQGGSGIGFEVSSSQFFPVAQKCLTTSVENFLNSSQRSSYEFAKI